MRFVSVIEHPNHCLKICLDSLKQLATKNQFVGKTCGFFGPLTSWWLNQPIWKIILVNLDPSFSKFRGEKKNFETQVILEMDGFPNDSLTP